MLGLDLVRRGSGISVGTSSWPADLKSVLSCPATPYTGALVSQSLRGSGFYCKNLFEADALSSQCLVFFLIPLTA